MSNVNNNVNNKLHKDVKVDLIKELKEACLNVTV